MNSITTRPGNVQAFPLDRHRSNSTMELPSHDAHGRPNDSPSPGSFVHSLLHRTLTHPLAIAAKRPLKDGWWFVRGMALSNPRMPARVESMLFVCKGNICRSPFAAVRAAQLLRNAGRADIRCTSAGITATQAARPPQDASDAASAFGVGFADHEPVRLTRDLIDLHDLTVVMEADQLIHLRQQYPHAIGRILLLSLLDRRGGYARYNIADPFGQQVEAFRSCYARIDGALQALLSQLPSAHAAATVEHGGPNVQQSRLNS
jgi:protein-tyrosine-phosphatase